MVLDIVMIAMLLIGFGLMRLFVEWTEKQVKK